MTVADVVLDELSFALRNLFYERPVDKLAKSLVTLHANHPLPQMRISVPQDRDRFWTSPLSQGRPKPERSPQETGLLETSAAKPRDTAATESVVDRPDVLRLRFEPRLRMGKDRRRIPAGFHRDHLARKLSVPPFVFSGGNLLPNCGQSRIAM